MRPPEQHRRRDTGGVPAADRGAGGPVAPARAGRTRRAGGEASRAERMEAQRTVARQLRAALEVFDGRRPAAHIADLVAPSVLRYWRAAAGQRRVRGRPGSPGCGSACPATAWPRSP